MAARIQVTGPCGAYVITPDFSFALLGTAQVRPRIQWRREWEPVFNDLGGKVPFDMQYMGSDALVSFDLTRHDPDVLESLRALPTMEKSKLGTEEFGAIGSLMIQEELAAGLALAFPYSTITNTGLKNGVHFPNAWLLGPDDEENGTQHQIQRIVFYCLRSFDETTGTFTLYDTDVSAGLNSSVV